MRAPSPTGVVAAAGAWMFAWLPSLLPNGTVLQGVALGVLAAVGYGIGSAIGALARLGSRAVRSQRQCHASGSPRNGEDSAPPLNHTELNPPPPNTTTAAAGRGGLFWAWAVASGFAIVALLSGLWLASGVNSQATSIGAPQFAVQWWVASGIGLVVATLLIGVGRGLRAITRKIDRALRSRLGTRVPAQPIAVAVTVSGCLLVIAGGFAATQMAFNRIDASVTGTSAPQSPTRSGSPTSLIAFDSLGKEGRQFVTQGNDDNTIRAFAGLESASDPRARAELAVQDMLRAGGADADVWVGITTTGNGFVDPVAAQAAETASGGRSALVAIQYSTLPSWLSFLVNQSSARDAGIATFEALAAARDALPAEQRPKLVLYGESLGAFGSPAPFAGMDPADVAAKIDGALWVGPPAATDPITQWTYEGLPPLWQPTLDAGRIARYAATTRAAEAPPGDGSWPEPRILVLQNPTDPVVWFSPNLTFSPAQWLAEPRGPGVQSGTRWLPVFFFLQIALDLPQAVGMPPGYGHDYSQALPAAWEQVLGG